MLLVQTHVEAACLQRLNLKCDELLSSIAFNLKLWRYSAPVADKRDRQRLANMFAKNAAAATAGAPKRQRTEGGASAMDTAQDADALLEDILNGVGGDDAGLPAVAAAASRRPPPSAAGPTPTAVPPGPVNQFRRPAPHHPPTTVGPARYRPPRRLELHASGTLGE